MGEPIVNKVAKSPLINFDLEEWIPKGQRTLVDLSKWLEDGFLLREKPFREALKQEDWSIYQDHYIAINCSTDAILPAWAALLVTSYLEPFAKDIVMGTLEDLERHLFSKIIAELDTTPFKDKPLMIKGCSDPSIPKDAYVQLIKRLQPVAKSLFYGEACSSVPLWKANNKRESSS
jgi:hypothetical protein